MANATIGNIIPDADGILKSRFPTANPTINYVFPHDDGGASSGTAAQQTPRIPATAPGAVAPAVTSPAPGGTGTSTPPLVTPPPLDWHAYLVNWGFDQGIVDELDRIFRTYNDPSQASAAALAYIRGTDWYKKTFPGISEGLSKGIIGNEQDYRSYTNNLNDLYNRYYGRNVTGAEVAGFLQKGYNVGRTGQQLAGEAYVKTYGNEDQYLLGAFDEKGPASPGDLQALGEENAGLDSLVGQQLQHRLDLARQRMQGAFQGALASPSLRILNNGRIAASGLSGGISPTDVGA